MSNAKAAGAGNYDDWVISCSSLLEQEKERPKTWKDFDYDGDGTLNEEEADAKHDYFYELSKCKTTCDSGKQKTWKDFDYNNNGKLDHNNEAEDFDRYSEKREGCPNNNPQPAPPSNPGNAPKKTPFCEQEEKKWQDFDYNNNGYIDCGKEKEDILDYIEELDKCPGAKKSMSFPTKE